MPGTTGSVTSGKPRLRRVDGHEVVAVHQQLEHAAQAALAVEEADRRAELVVQPPRGAAPGGGDAVALLLVVERREELRSVGAHQLRRQVEVAGEDDPLDPLGAQPVDRAVELGVDVPVVALAAERDDADLAVVLGVDVELLPLGRGDAVERLRVPRARGGRGVQLVVALDQSRAPRRRRGRAPAPARRWRELRAQLADRR